MTRLILVLFCAALLAACATTQFTETTKSADGEEYSCEYSARKFNPLGKTEMASESFRYTTEGDTSEVETGQAIEGQDNTAANAVMGTLIEAIVDLANPVPPVLPLEPIENLGGE